MKILWFTNTPCRALERLTGTALTGGGWLLALSEHLKHQPDTELHIAFYWGQNMASFEYEDVTYHPVLREGEGSIFGRYIHRLASQFSSKSDEKEVERLLTVVEAVHPDIIHIHGSEENFGMMAPLLPDNKIVLSVQGLLSPILGKRYAGIPYHDIVRNESLVKRIMMDGAASERRRNKRAALREQSFMPYIHNVIGRTEWDKNATLALNPLRRYFTCNEILREDFFTHQWQPRAEEHTFTICTTISNGMFKGLETVYRTAEILTRWGIPFKWNIIGVDKTAPYAKVTQKYTGICPEKVGVELLGRKTAAEMVNVLLMSDLYCNCSHIENSPNSVCEAMLLGMPIIASCVGGTSTLLKDREEGLLVQDGEPYALAGMIMAQKNNPESGIARGIIAREQAEKRHSPQDVCSRLMNIYTTL